MRILCWSTNGPGRIFDMQQKTQLFIEKTHDAEVLSIDCLSAADLVDSESGVGNVPVIIVSSSRDRKVSIMEFDVGKRLVLWKQTVRDHTSPVTGVGFTFRQQGDNVVMKLVSGAVDKSLILRDICFEVVPLTHLYT